MGFELTTLGTDAQVVDNSATIPSRLDSPERLEETPFTGHMEVILCH
jgi:hypothetical protein